MRILRLLLTLVHLFVIVLLIGTLLNDYISPQSFPWFNLLSLAFPVLMIVNVVLCILWIIFRKKSSFFFLTLSLLLFYPAQRWINYSKKVNEKPNFKMVTMNIKGATFGRDKIYDYLKNSKADLILGQEYGTEFNVPGYEYRTDQYGIVALNTKIEIINQKKIETAANGNAFYADIKFEGKPVRIINIYLNPFSFDKAMVKPTENLEQNKGKILDVLRKLLPTFRVHQQEIKAIRKVIDESPYPVILAGDFNSVPNSYEYYRLGKGLTDVFVKVGRGSATSFHDYKFPIRIDYIFTSKEIKPVSYQVDRSVKLSDHFPVIAEFKID